MKPRTVSRAKLDTLSVADQARDSFSLCLSVFQLVFEHERDMTTELSGTIDRSSPLPLHHQLRVLLERQIATGKWTQGERLPSEPTLSEHYAVSRPTVRQALQALEQQGLINRQKGRGAFVNKSTSGSWLVQWAGGLFDDELSRRGLVVESQVLRAAVEPLPQWASDALELAPDTPGVALERLRSIAGEVALYGKNHLPSEYGDTLSELWTNPRASLYGTLRDQHGLEVASSSRIVEAVAAPRAVANLLGLPARAPVAYIQSLAREASGRAIDCFRAWLRTDRLRIAVETDTRMLDVGRVVSHSLAATVKDEP